MKKKHKSTKIIVVVAIILAIAVVAVIVETKIFSKSEKETQQNEAEYSDSITQGDKYLEKLDYSQAILSYNEALNIEPNNLEAKLKLADAYEQSDDYSKAEETYKEIINKGNDTTEAYSKLAELYIRKNDLEKAKQLLEEAVKNNKSEELLAFYKSTQIDAPKYSVTSGSYDDRKEVEIKTSSDNDIIYYTTDGSNPTTKSNVYTDSIILPNGNTTILSMAVNQLGYYSDVSKAEYTINIEDVNVDFTNKTIENAVKKALNKSSSVTNYDVDRIRQLYILGDGSYVAYASNATFDGEQTYVSSSSSSSYKNTVKPATIEDISDLSKLPNLKQLYIADVSGFDLSLIASLTNLETLALVNDGITDISAIGGLTKLTKLSINWNNVSDISALSKLNNLAVLSMCGNKLTDVTSISGLTKLTYLDISQNQISDISKLSTLSELEQLWAYNNKIANYSSLVQLRKLDVLMIKNNDNTDKESLTKIFPRLSRTDYDVNNAK